MNVKDSDVVQLETDRYSSGASLPAVSIGADSITNAIASLSAGSNDVMTAFLIEGFKGAILQPNSTWTQGKFYFRLEFVPDSPQPAASATAEQ
jgi:hypothetical protein